MKVHKVTLLIVDTDDVGETEIKSIIENIKYPNWCIAPDVMAFESREIDWNDGEHPINDITTYEAEFERLFGA